MQYCLFVTIIYSVLLNEWMVMDNEFEMLLKETVLVLFEVLSQCLSAGNEEFHKISYGGSCSDSQYCVKKIRED